MKHCAAISSVVLFVGSMAAGAVSPADLAPTLAER